MQSPAGVKQCLGICLLAKKKIENAFHVAQAFTDLILNSNNLVGTSLAPDTSQRPSVSQLLVFFFGSTCSKSHVTF